LHKVKLSDTSSSYGGIPLYSDSESVYIEKDDVHTLIIGSTGSKKTRLIGMPALYLYALAGESFIASDPKGELYESTMPTLKKYGYKSFVLNLRDPLQSNSWNPLFMPYRLYKDGFRDKAIELINDMANCIVKSYLTQEAYWQNSTANLLAGLILTLFECAEEYKVTLKSLRTLRTQAFGSHESEDGTFIKGESSTLIREKLLKYLDKSSFIYSLLSGTADVCEVTRSCIVSQFDQAMQPFFSQDNLIDMLSGTNIDMENFGKRKTAVFLIIPDENTLYHSLISVFIKQCYTRLIHEAQKLASKKLPRRVNFLLDEFSSLPQISDFPAMITASRSRNIRFNLIIQSVSQLKKRYGHEAETIKGNCENWVLLHSRELSLLNEIIELCGNKNADEPLVSVSRLQTMNKEKGEAFILNKRNYPYIAHLPDIDKYPLIRSKKKGVKYPANKNKANFVFNFEEFCFLATPESLSRLFSNRKEEFENINEGFITEPVFIESSEEELEERDIYSSEIILDFITELSALKKNMKPK
ncbi:MAG: type IV secretory system conjugative DNA transfer family protein, partial [Treponema sp.]|nr:type IV secretory system conjugative DNA transfer family protein [Treponema sp.]